MRLLTGLAAKLLECRFLEVGRTAEEGYGGEVAGERWALDAMAKDTWSEDVFGDHIKLEYRD